MPSPLLSWFQPARFPTHAVLAATALGVAVLEVAAGIDDSTLGFATAMVLAVIGTVFGFAAVAIRRGRAGFAAILSAGALFSAVPMLSAIHGPDAGTTLAPAIAFLLLLPHLEGRRVFGVAALAVIATAIPEVSGVLMSDAYAPSGTIPAALGVMTGSALLIALSWRIQRATRAASRRYEDLVANLPIGVARIAPDGRRLEVNDAFVAMLRYPDRQALIDAPLSALYSPGQSERLLAEFEVHDHVATELPLERYDGTSVWARMHARVERDDRGRPKWYDGSIEDVTAEHAAAEARDRLAAIVESAGDAMFANALDGTILSWNEAAERVYGWTAEEAIGESVYMLSPEAEHLSVRGNLATVAAGRRVGPIEVTRIRRDGRPVTISLIVSPLHGPVGSVVAASAVARDVTAQRATEARLERLRHERDLVVAALRTLRPQATLELTADAICAEISRAGFGHSVLLGWEVDDEVRILATQFGGLGSLVSGGTLSVDCARTLRAAAETGPWVDESIVEGTNPYRATMAVSGVRALAYIPIADGHDLTGLLVVGSPGVDGVRLSERLPALIEFAAIAGVLIGPGIQTRRVRLAAHNAVMSVIEARAFSPVFQPIIGLDDMDVVGYEALTRFTNGQGPEEVFRAAAEAGLGLELEALTLRAALEAASTLPGHAYLDLNASPELVLAGEPLRSILANARRDVVLEITEHTQIVDYDRFRRAVKALPRTRLAIDDAGAGFASLRHIAELSPFAVKLDRSLVSGIDVDPARRGLVTGMVHFARAVGCSLIAEGIETVEEATALRELGVRVGQGYLLGRPLPVAELRDRTARDGVVIPLRLPALAS